MNLNSIFTLAYVVATLTSLSIFTSGCAHSPATPKFDRAPGSRFAKVTRPRPVPMTCW